MYSEIRKKRFDQVWDLIQAKGLISQIFPEEAKMRYSLPLKNGMGQYIFKLNRNGDADNLTTFAISENDVFVPSGIAIMIGLTGTDGVQHLFPFAPKNDGVNPSVYPFGFQNDNIEALWNGNLTFKQDTNIVLNQYPMERFKKVPRQQGAFVLDSNDADVQEGIQLEWSIDKYLELLMARYAIAGNRDNYITVNFDAANKNFPVTTDYTAELVLFMDGFLVKGGAQTYEVNGRRVCAFDDAPARF